MCNEGYALLDIRHGYMHSDCVPNTSLRPWLSRNPALAPLS